MSTMSLDNVLSLVIQTDIYERWSQLRAVQGFTSDAEIASFLLQYYESSKGHTDSERYCIYCHMVLPPLCKTCEVQQEQLSQQQPQLSQQQPQLSQQQPQLSQRQPQLSQQQPQLSQQQPQLSQQQPQLSQQPQQLSQQQPQLSQQQPQLSQQQLQLSQSQLSQQEPQLYQQQLQLSQQQPQLSQQQLQLSQQKPQLSQQQPQLSEQQQQLSEEPLQQQSEEPLQQQPSEFPSQDLTVITTQTRAQLNLLSSSAASQNAETSLPLMEVPQEIVFIEASNEGSFPVDNSEKILFTNVGVTSIQSGNVAGDFSIDGVKREMLDSLPSQAAESSQAMETTEPSVLETGLGQESSLSGGFELKGTSFTAKVFHISDMDKLEVGAVFTTCERRIRRKRVRQQPDENSPVTSEVSCKDNQKTSVHFDDTPQVEASEVNVEEGEGEEQEEEEKSPEDQLLPPLFIERRKPYSTRKTWGKPPYLCQTCGASFKSTSTLSRHIFKHTGERPYPCHQCDAAFISKPELKNHFRKHTGEKPFLCPICGSAFDRSTNLNTHMRTHSGERPYKCDECGACFTTSSSLNRHRRVHTGEKPYVCSQCDAAFPQLGHLKDHVQRHSGTKPFQCQDCGSTFCTRARLLRHQRKVQCSASSTAAVV